MPDLTRIYGYDGATWREVLVDGTGRLIIVTAAGVGVDTHCHGYDGANWQQLLVESAASANLRTRLYDGVNPIISVGTAADIADANRGLFTQAGVRGWDGTFWKSVNVEDDAGDALANARASLSVVSKLYGYNGASWDRLRVESAAAFNLRVRLYDGANGIDAQLNSTVTLPDATYSLITAATLRLSEAGADRWREWYTQESVVDADPGAIFPPVGLMGYNGATWDRLRLESAALHNLRVRLYDGANGVDAQLNSAVVLPDATYSLITAATLRLSEAGADRWREWYTQESVVDADPGAIFPPVGLMGYNGATFDRLRTWGTGILRVGRAPTGLLTVRKTAVGQVGAVGGRQLYWMTMNPTAANSVVELTDDATGLTAVVWDMTHGVNSSHHMNIDPPMEFTNGIYLKTFNNMTSIIFGYK